MFNFNSPAGRTCNQFLWNRLLSLLCLTTTLVFAQGCESPPATQQAAAPKDPQGDFEWVIKRLKRAIQPSSGGGLTVADRQLEHKLLPPTEDLAYYTATVTISTETHYLPKRHTPVKTKKTNQAEETEIIDPLADKEAELNKPLDLSDMDGLTLESSPARVQPQIITNTTVFKLQYLEGQWQLTEQPELDFQQGWFEYALQ